MPSDEAISSQWPRLLVLEQALRRGSCCKQVSLARKKGNESDQSAWEAENKLMKCSFKTVSARIWKLEACQLSDEIIIWRAWAMVLEWWVHLIDFLARDAATTCWDHLTAQRLEDALFFKLNKDQLASQVPECVDSHLIWLPASLVSLLYDLQAFRWTNNYSIILLQVGFILMISGSMVNVLNM